MMRVHNGFYVAEPESKSFDIVNISSRNSVEFFENIFYLIRIHSLSMILYFNKKASFTIPCMDLDFWSVGTVFIGIVQSVVKNITEVILISFDDVDRCIHMESDRTISTVDLQSNMIFGLIE